jgi:hypothetical protein
LLIGAGLLVVVALAVALVVIPQVRVEASRGGTPEKAVTAFWLNVAFSLLSALALFVAAIRLKVAGWISRSVLILVGLVVLFLGVACIDAAFAYITHNPDMRSGSILLFICGAADLLVGVVTIGTAFLIPRKS